MFQTFISRCGTNDTLHQCYFNVRTFALAGSIWNCRTNFCNCIEVRICVVKIPFTHVFKQIFGDCCMLFDPRQQKTVHIAKPLCLQRIVYGTDFQWTSCFGHSSVLGWMMTSIVGCSHVDFTKRSSSACRNVFMKTKWKDTFISDAILSDSLEGN